MEMIKICRICLNTQVKMYHDDLLNSYYKQLLHIDQDLLVERWHDVGTDIVSVLPSFICYECRALLIKSYEFQQKCMRSFKLMQSCIQGGKLMYYKVLSLNRFKNKLTSNLGRMKDSPRIKVIQHCEDIVDEQCANDDFESKIPISIVDQSSLTTQNARQEFVGNTNAMNNENVNDEPCEIKMEIVDCDLHFEDDNNDFLNTSMSISEREIEPEQFIVPDRLDTLAVASQNQNNAFKESKMETHENINVVVKSKRKSKHDKMKINETIKLEEHSISDDIVCIDDEPQIDENKWRTVTFTKQEAKKKFKERKKLLSYRASKFKCKLCLKGFFCKSNLNNHLQRHNNLEKKYTCHICQLKFDKRIQLDTHSDTHFREYHCLQCDFVTAMRLEIGEHEQTHNLNNRSKFKSASSMLDADQQTEDA